MTRKEEQQYMIKKIRHIKEELESADSKEEEDMLTLFLYDIRNTLYMLCHRQAYGIAPIKIEDV